MTWNIHHKPSFTGDFIDLNKDLQKAVVRGLEELEQDPVTPRGNTIKKLQGFENVYRYRLGDFRLIYAASLEARALQLLAVGPRSSIYENFNYPGWDAPGAAVEFGPELAAQDVFVPPKEWFQPTQEKEPLPRKLTPRLLTKWRIDGRYHHDLMGCLYAEDLLNLPESKQVPQEVVGRVMDCLYETPVDQLAGQPDLVLFNPEDLLRYAEGDLAGFLLRLDKQQEPLTRWALSGPTLVKGGPGSGKSTVALYRLRNLVAKALEEAGELPTVLFTTYTNALINLSESLLTQVLDDVLPGDVKDLPPEIAVSTLHKIARQIVVARRPVIIAGDPQKEEALQAARYSLQPREFGDVAKMAVASALARFRDDYLLDEFEWVIEGQDCRSEADYLTADRTGRGVPFPEATRQAVWQLYQAYRAILEDQELLSFGMLIQAALDVVRAGDSGFAWDFVLVDEAQDLPPAALALAVELCRDPTGLFLTADANQSLYNRGFRWTNVHERLNVTGRTRILRRNYRSTRQIAAAASEILAPLPDYDAEAMEQEYVHVGRRPILYGAAGSADQARWIGQHIYQAAKALRLPVNAAAVLVPTRREGEPLANALSDHGLPAKFMNSREFDLDETFIKVTTLYAAKGLEFPIVVVAHAEDGRLPRDTDATAA
ncbi:MAG: 3'-5' exonuclease, partial [Candidatus Promineifilaceae bacterium]|nr:3'-5' exonuclease [Candidatus Promineifilaceae bacterium]